jgi:hypothetical protein
MFLFFDNPSVIVQQVPPQIQVNVEMPPGMPEWVKILISAAVGALFAMLGGIVMEYLKPLITKQRTRKMVRSQLAAELLDNMSFVHGAVAILGESEKVAPGKRDAVVSLAATMLRMTNTDRFDHFFTNEKMLVYEVDDDKSLSTFYEVVKTTIPGVLQSRNYSDMRIMIGEASRLAHQYIDHHKLEYGPPKTPDTAQMLANSIAQLAQDQT